MLFFYINCNKIDLFFKLLQYNQYDGLFFVFDDNLFFLFGGNELLLKINTV